MMSPRMGRKQPWTRWALGVGAIGLVVFGPGAYQMVRMSLMQRQLDGQLASLSAEHERLVEEQERLHSDPTYVEGLIRTTFKVSQPGEYVIPLKNQSGNQ